MFLAIDCIYLQLLDKIQSGNNIFDLHSHKVITRHNIIETPTIKAIIKHIEEMAARDNAT